MATARQIDRDIETSTRAGRRSVRHAVVVLLASVFAVSACSDAPNPLEPAASTAPEMSVAASCTEGGYTPVEAAQGRDANTRMRVIGPKGGRLNVATHELVVPAGAVAEPTLFVMEAAKEHVAVELNAYRWNDDDQGVNGAPALENSGQGPNSAGRANASAFTMSTSDPVESFDRNVKLYLSYRHADVDDPASLEIKELQGDPESCGALGEAVTTGIDEKRKRVEAELEHFSGYIMVAG